MQREPSAPGVHVPTRPSTTSPDRASEAPDGQRRFPRETLFLVALAVLFGVPFALAKLNPGLEPFPAILLPSGADLVLADESERTFTVVTAYGQRHGSAEWVRVDPVRLIDPVLPQYFTGLASTGFGLRPVPGRELGLRGLGIRVRLQDRYRPEAAQETTAWLRERLTRLGFAPDTLRVTRERVTYHENRAEPIETTLLHEAVYRLD